LEVAAEFAERGVVRGVQLMDPAGGFGIAPRDREFCAGKPVLAGFDVFALEVDSVAVLHRLAQHSERLGIEHDGVQDRGAYGASLDVADPDGTVLRFLANNVNAGAGQPHLVRSGSRVVRFGRACRPFGQPCRPFGQA
jgi:hypothetical protein